MAQQNAPRAKKQIHKAVSKKRKFVKDGVFYAELNDFLANELSEQGYAGCEVRVTPQRTEIIIRATNTGDVIGDNGRRIRELTALIQKRFKFPRNGLICFAERVRNKGFSALTQAQAVKYRLLTGLTVRRAAYSCLKYIMDDSDRKNGAMGCEIIVSGKLRGQRAKGMKFRDGFMIHAGDAANYYIDTAVKHVHLPQGVIGIKVKIMKPYDSTGRDGVTMELPDKIQVLEPKDENESGRIGGVQDMAEHLRGLTRPQGGGGGGGGGGGPTGGQGGPPPPQPPAAPQGPPRPRPPMAPQNNQGGGGGGYGGSMDDQFGRGDGGGGAMDQGQAQQDTQQQMGGGGGDMGGGAQQFDVNQGQAPQQPQYGTQPAQGQEYGQQFDQYGGQQGGQGGGGQYGQQQQGQQYHDQFGNPVSTQQQYGGGGGGQPQYGGQTGQQGQGGGQYNNQQGGGYYEQNRGGNYPNY